MRITDLLKSNAIELNVSLRAKDEAIDKLIALHEKAGNLTDAAKYKEDILQRESHSTTAARESDFSERNFSLWTVLHTHRRMSSLKHIQPLQNPWVTKRLLSALST